MTAIYFCLSWDLFSSYIINLEETKIWYILKKKNKERDLMKIFSQVQYFESAQHSGWVFRLNQKSHEQNPNPQTLGGPSEWIQRVWDKGGPETPHPAQPPPPSALDFQNSQS